MLYGKFIDAEGMLAFQLKFLHKAVSYDEARYFLREMFIEPSEKYEGQLRGIATCGNRLHIVDPLESKSAEFHQITPGYWRGLRSFKNDRIWIARLDDMETRSFRFPDWQKVIPNGEGVEYRTAFEGFSVKSKINIDKLAKLFHGFPDATAINLKYLEDLGTGFTWDVEWYGPQKAIKFTQGNRTAVVMPMRLG
jgi:hypothetical protein